MKTIEERLNFVMQFEHMQFDDFQEEDWIALRDELQHFLAVQQARTGDTIPLLKEGTKPALKEVMIEGVDLSSLLPQEFKEEHFRSLQKDVRDILYGLENWPGGVARGKSKTLQLKLSLSPLFIPYTGKYQLTIQGSVCDLFLYILINLIAQQPANKWARCPACNTLFVRVRKQRYCSRRCTKRENMRDWRKTEKGKQYDRTRAAAYYEDRMKAKGARVQHRRQVPAGNR
jgi:hypothetical protein